MFKRSVMITLLFMSALVLIVSGCTGQKAPKDTLSLAVSKMLEADSYVVESRIQVLGMELGSETADEEGISEPSESSAMSALLPWLKNADIHIRQVYHKEPTQSEAVLEIKLQGKMATTVTLPLVITPGKLYVQLPNTPLVPMPEELVGQFVVLDFKELTQQSGQAVTGLPKVSGGEVQQLGATFMTSLLAGFDGDTYFKYAEVEQAALPEGVLAKQVVQFAVSNDLVQQAREVLKGQVLPEVRSSWEQQGYSFLPENLAEGMVIHQLTAQTVIDEQNYPVYTTMDADLTLDIPSTSNAQESARITLRMTRQYSEINEQPAFVTGIPTNTIGTAEWEEAMRSFGY